MATAITAADGAYRVANLPAGKIVLTASRSGYYSRPPQTLVNCVAQGDYPRNDFDLLRAGVVSGRVVDETGEPVERARLTIHKSQGPGVSPPIPLPSAIFTDDRGMFRVAGLEPGSYVVTAQKVDLASFLAVSSAEIAIRSGAETPDIAITLERQQRVDISGTVTGLETADGKARLLFQSLATPRMVLFPRTVEKDGHFVVQPRIPVGGYRIFGVSSDREGTETKALLLDRLDVQSDIRDLALRPLPGATVRGKLKLVSGTVSSPLQLVLSLEGMDTRRVKLAPPDFSFEIQNLLPGSYAMELDSPEILVKEIVRGKVSGPPRLIGVGPGEVLAVEVVAATRYGRVYGGVQVRGLPVPSARVALDGAGGARVAEADENGRFQFAEVAPGQYRICAWRELVPELLGREDTWKKAGCADRRFQVESGAAVELALTVAP